MIIDFSGSNIEHLTTRPIAIDAPQIVMLIGLPGSGKSTWRYNADCHSRPCVILSSDDLIEEYAREQGLNYTEAFGRVDFKPIEAKIFEMLKAAVAAKHDIIVDRTNMRAKSRNRFMANVTKDYLKAAIVFELSDEVLTERLARREDATGKHIPRNVIEDMRQGYEPPTAEQFDVVVRV